MTDNDFLKKLDKINFFSSNLAKSHPLFDCNDVSKIFLEMPKNLKHAIACIVSFKVENFLKGGLDLIPSPSTSMEIQIMGWTVCLKCKGKTLLGVVNKLLEAC